MMIREYVPLVPEICTQTYEERHHKHIISENSTEINLNIRNDIIYISKIVMEQNYFQFDRHYYKQREELAMGAPTSTILAEIFIQHTEHKHIITCTVVCVTKMTASSSDDWVC
jgi:ectoine hydroxylase-related dioxygenase (phytanoyl-CoA dioxygenase family)